MLSLGEDKAMESETIASIVSGVDFSGAKLWILVLAIFVASLGLNTNSTAVIIGAMLISPLMGPIIGMGLGVGINDFMLLKRAFKNYLVATLFSVATATLYFLITPFNEAQSELLARTSPTIYDVLIALCGGLAGIIALGSLSQRSGNVIPGVAIATALMPPLCTVGFGLATANWLYALGALYLYLINTIFISVATFVGVTLIMRFHKKEFVDKQREKRVKRTIMGIAIITIIPSVFITLGMVKEAMFNNRCKRFCTNVVKVEGAHIISHTFDYKNRSMRVVLLGEEADSAAINMMKERMADYGLEETTLEIVQGTSNMKAEDLSGRLHLEEKQTLALQNQVMEYEKTIREQRAELDAYAGAESHAKVLLPELRTLYPTIESVSTGRGVVCFKTDSVLADSTALIVSIRSKKRLPAAEQSKVEAWLRKRLSGSHVYINWCD